MFQGQDFLEVPPNDLGLTSGAILLPTTQALTLGGGTSLDFVIGQGGDKDTFVFLLGLSTELKPFRVIEGVFLSAEGPGFRATWGTEQLALEVTRGGWTVIPKDLVLADWVERVEARMNA